MRILSTLFHGLMILSVVAGMACTKAPSEGVPEDAAIQEESSVEAAPEGQGLSPDDAGMKGKFQEAPETEEEPLTDPD